MAEIGDKAFTTDLMTLVKQAIRDELGTNAFVNRYLAEVTAVDTATSAVTIKLSGSDTTSANFRARGLQMPSVGDQVIACIDGEDRWIESVVRPATSTPFLQISSGSIVGAGVPTGAIVAWSMVNPPSGWLVCNGTNVSRTTYASLFAVIGTNYGVGDGSTTFGLPNLTGAFLGGQASHTTQPARNTGTLGPNSTFSAASHNHSVGIAHGHADDFSASGSFTGSSHSHTVSGSTGSTTLSTTTRDTGVYSVTYDVSHTHGNGNLAGASATATGNVGVTLSGGVTDLPATTVTSGNTQPTVGTPLSFLANFIIKT